MIVNQLERKGNLYPKEYDKILSKDIFDTLSDLEKEEILKQIEEIESDFNWDGGIKIRVRPWMINFLRKLLKVDSFKWWAFFGNVIYLSHPDDLFNRELITHESTHLKQQQELSPIKLIWFIKRLLICAKDMKKYKEENWNHKYINYEATTMIPTELEAYGNQWDYMHLWNRKFMEYASTDSQKIMKKIETRDYHKFKKNFNLTRDMWKLEEIMNKTKDTEWEMMRVFNDLDRVSELVKVEKVLKIKLDLLKNPEDKNLYIEFLKLKTDIDRELFKFNIITYLEDDFSDQVVLEEKLEEIRKNITKYRRESTIIWLEPKDWSSKWIEIAIWK